VLGVLLVVVVIVGYWLKAGPERVARAEVARMEAAMQAGLDLLYKGNDPAAAAAEFRRVLALTPRHYGATFQLATALDRAGKTEEARPYWEAMRALAEAAKDEGTLATVRTRLAKASPSTEEALQAAMMSVGLDALYRRRDPVMAASEFRRVLQRNPTHYGATFQLATALDRAGKGAEARPFWERVLEMAERQKDEATLAAARARLARHP
jgi:Tfp pilus assembly protein PilF